MRQKIRRLRLEVVGAKGYMSTTSIAMPKELPSVEEALKKLVAAMNALACQGVLLKSKQGQKCLFKVRVNG